jgi:hypothetical protein
MSDLFLTLDQSGSAPISLSLVEEEPILNINVSEMTAPVALTLSPVIVGTQGAQGEQGEDGREVSIRVSGGYIQWQYSGAESWTNLIATSELKGDTGATGVAGSQGPAGQDGANGQDGSDGADGVAATITIGTVTTGAAGSSASVVNVGTETAAILNITIPTGADGQDGTNGSDGTDGTAATISVGTVATGEPGTSVSVTNSGTQSAAILNFVIPAGANGQNGANGLDGDDGREIEIQAGVTHIQWRYVGDLAWIDLVSLASITGPQGIQGIQGEQGLQGAMGAQGVQGETGATGAAGANGIDGDDGREVEIQKTVTHIQWRYVGDVLWTDLVALADITGPQGLQGIQGDIGATGASGANGENGASAYGVAVANGFIGSESEWLLSLKGAKGDIGDTGAQGTQGIQGIQGIQGPQGLQGIQGEPGIQGVAGANGTDGEDGASAYEVAVINGFVGNETQWLASLKGEKGDPGDQGIQGVQGEQGIQGIPGATGAQGEQGPQGVAGYSPIKGVDYFDGQDGSDGAPGAAGQNGVGVPTGGIANQILQKIDGTDYNTQWHTLTQSDVGLENVANTDTTTTANISDSLNKRFITDAQLTILGNTSGTNSGDNAANSLYSGLTTSKQDALVSGTNIKTINGSSILGSGDMTVSGGVSDGDKGDITVSSSGATWTIDNGTVTEAKMSFSDNTTGNASASAHGLLPKLGGGSTNFLREDGTWATPTGGTDDPITTMRTAPWYFWDYHLAGATTGNFSVGVINSGTASYVNTLSNHPGYLVSNSASSANSGVRTLLLGNFSGLKPFSGGEIYECEFQPKVSGNANTTMRFGFIDTADSTNVVDGAYFELAEGSLNLVGKTASNSSRSTSSTILTLVVDTWYRCRITVNSNATSVLFAVYSESGTLLGSASLTDNIPTDAAYIFSAGFVNTNSSTTPTLLSWLDYQFVQFSAVR